MESQRLRPSSRSVTGFVALQRKSRRSFTRSWHFAFSLAPPAVEPFAAEPRAVHGEPESISRYHAFKSNGCTLAEVFVNDPVRR